ncbi:GlcG/HbpS family heme-binding protein [Acinetobacter rudis]|uniref:Heme-binding protein n=1 Tax=Acinetobacter rudis CIP 110305 TaxID=421052 RepID=S3P4N1_9GAMM|nr:heme-binding protein [Acinetobacter rudis]EPF73771.1 hypothetical protein F945_01930 [Acinetobacter rudis CIP 110305]
MTYDDASNVLNTAIAKANQLNVAVTIAVVDTGGHLLSLARLDSVYGVVDFAIKKAKTAMMFGLDSDIMGNIMNSAEMNSYGMLNSNGGLLTVAGGVVIKDKQGKIIGAIGSSGGTPEQDKEIAATGAKVFSLI